MTAQQRKRSDSTSGLVGRFMPIVEVSGNRGPSLWLFFLPHYAFAAKPINIERSEAIIISFAIFFHQQT
jgi:hypothetical protein